MCVDVDVDRQADLPLEVAVVHLDLLVDAALAAGERAPPVDDHLAGLDVELDVFAAQSGQLEAHHELARLLLEVDVGQRHEPGPRRVLRAAADAHVVEGAQHFAVQLVSVHGTTP